MIQNILFEDHYVTFSKHRVEDHDRWMISFNEKGSAILFDEEDQFIYTLTSLKSAIEKFIEWKSNQIQEGGV